MSLPTTPPRSSYDVVIIGGAMIGSSIAWFLSQNPGLSVLVVERDPSYEFTSTSHTNSCIRQQFSNEINIRISQFGVEFIRNFREYMGNDPRVPQPSIHSFGYMYLAGTEAAAQAMRETQSLQAALGAHTRILTPDQIAAEYPFYDLDGIVLGSHNPVDEGYFDGNTLFDWWKRSARERGVTYISNQVTGMTLSPQGTAVTAVTLQSGESIACGTVVNATGPRAALTAAMAGIDLPVEPRKRFTFVFEAANPLSRDLPLTIDPSGVHVRTDGKYYMAGCKPFDDTAVDPGDFAMDHSIWQEWVWPTVATRIPQFESVRVISEWAGHYAYNTLDQNAIIGPHDRVANFIFANGFSGHGFQQSPAVGRGVAELISSGAYQTLDLSPFGFSRIGEGRPFLERAII